MFTDCPSCERLFRIRAAQLAAADGWVRCGYCAETFYALERLHDAPLIRSQARVQPVAAAPRLPTVDIGPAPEGEPVEESGQAETAAVVPDAEPVETIELHGPAFVEQEGAAEAGQAETAAAAPDAEPTETIELHGPAFVEQAEAAESGQAETAAAAPDAEPDEAIELHGPAFVEQEAVPDDPVEAGVDQKVLPDSPPPIFDETEATTGSSAHFIWGSLAIILLVVALAQLAWFNRDQLLREYPALAPWVGNICDRLQCEPIRFRDVSTIRLLNKEVRLHPDYRDALLASATMINDAGFTQPFPDVELVIFGSGGQMVSRGRFKPAEYLGADSRFPSGMPPDEPVRFELELAGVTQQAASFKFRFH